jgi:hypothetical protein
LILWAFLLWRIARVVFVDVVVVGGNSGYMVVIGWELMSGEVLLKFIDDVLYQLLPIFTWSFSVVLC